MLREIAEDWLQFAIAACRDINAPSEIVWAAINDVESFTAIFPEVTAVEFLEDTKAGESVRVGSKHRVHRRSGHGEDIYGDWVVTEMSIDTSSDSSSSCKYKITYFSNDLATGMTASTTWLVEPIKSEDIERCRVTITLAIVPHTFVLIAGRLTCCCLFRRVALSSTERDLDGLANYCEMKADAEIFKGAAEENVSSTTK